jgi:hypothetical protein
MITQVFCYARESCKELNEISSSPLNVTKELQSSDDGEYISFKLDNKSHKYNSGYGFWYRKGGYKYTGMSASDSDTSERIMISFNGKSKGTYRISKKYLFNQIHYYNEDGELWVAAATAGKGTIKIKYYGSVGNFIRGSFSGVLMDYFSNSDEQQKSEITWKKHRIRGTFKVKRLSNIKQSVSNTDESMNAVGILKHEAAEAVYSVRENN